MYPEKEKQRSLQEQQDYWKHKIRDIQPLQWLTDFPRPPVPSYRRETAFEALDHDTLEKFCSLTNHPREITLLTVLKILLLRHTNQENICVGCFFSEGESNANLLPVITNFVGSSDFLGALNRVKTALGEAGNNSDCPFESIAGLAEEEGAGGAPILQVLYVTQDQEEQAQFSDSAARCDLVFVYRNGPGESGIACHYDSDLFQHETIERILSHYRILLEGAMAGIHEEIRRLPILTEAEKRLLEHWNNTAKDYPRDLTIHKIFERQVETNPDSIALSFGSEDLTYSELNRRANRVAHFLIHEQHLKLESLVGILMERSIEMIVAMIGVLKAGCAYLPLDPDYPQERLRFILHDAQVPVVLTQTRLAKHLMSGNSAVVCVDDSDALPVRQIDSNPDVPVSAKNLCYIMYTSGSTGKPKGVCAEHRGVVRTVTAENYSDITAEDVFLQIVSICFDASCTEIWGSLLKGARLVLFPHEKPTIAGLEKIINERGLTAIYLTPGLFDRFMESGPKNLGNIRKIFTGGDVISVRYANRAVEAMQNGTVFNGYGPSECTDLSTTYRLTAPYTSGAIPIGRPFSNTTIHILDPLLQPVPIGVRGEIYVGGDGVGRGYLNRPELTAEKFSSDPFSLDPEARLYRSGDFGRWLMDGNVEFLGRTDHQVKVRGFRIELEEIQHVLRQNAGVQSCVVRAIQESETEKKLVAYVISRRIPSVTTEELRSFLKERLPDYMIPSYFLFLESFPLTVGGKIDRKALESMDYKKPAEATGHNRPRTELELKISQIWCEALGVKEIGIYDDFFELGGHSLIAMQILNRLKETFQMDLSIRSLFNAGTIASLSASISARQKDPD